MNHLTSKTLVLSALVGQLLVSASLSHAEDKPTVTKPALTCKLLTSEAPAGGRLDVEASHFGTTPVVRIAGKAMRMIERTATRIGVQISADSNGGEVTLQAGKQNVVCGTLVITGQD
jgi:hypothetical protein